MRPSRITMAVFMVAALMACSSGEDITSDDKSETLPGAAVAAVSEDMVAAPDAENLPEPEATVPAAFAQCRSCHAIEPGQNRIGPSLAGVFGAKAGHVDSYNYSTALKDSGLSWNEAALDSYLKSPREKVPGTKMTFPGVKNDAVRAEVILYIKTL